MACERWCWSWWKVRPLGALLGTAAYMSPEQAKGKPVDRRADVWAFGAVLFEMLTGARLFSGETASETLASVINDEPSFERLQAATPPHIRRLLRRCLTKDPRERLQAIGEARIAIDRPEVEARVAADKERIAVPALILAGVAIVAALWGWLARVPAATTAAASIEAMLEPGVVRVLDGKGLALSPDGMRLAFVGMDASGNRAIWIRPLDGRDDVVRVPGTVGGSWPFWSPDGRTLGFAAGDEIQTVELASGTKRTVPIIRSHIAFIFG